MRDAYGVTIERNSYRPSGALWKKEDACGLLEEYTYDLFGNPIKIETARTKERGSQGRRYAYDANGFLQKSIDGEANETIYDLDAWGRIIGIHRADGSEETYAYNRAGDLISTTDGNGGTIQYEYDAFGAITQIVDQTGHVETYQYDGEGRKKAYRDRNQREECLE